MGYYRQLMAFSLAALGVLAVDYLIDKREDDSRLSESIKRTSHTQTDRGIIDLMDHVYSNGKVTLHIIGENHSGNDTHTMVKQANPQCVCVEGLVGLVDDTMVSQIKEDQALIKEMNLRIKQGTYIIGYGSQGILDKDGMLLAMRKDRLFLGTAPGSALVDDFYGKIPIFGYEDAKIRHNIQKEMLRQGLEYLKSDILHITALGINPGFKELEPIFPSILEEIDAEMPDLSNPFSGLGNNLDMVVIRERSRQAVKNSLESIGKNGYTDAAIVMGYTHLPSLYEILESAGFNCVN